MKDLFDNDLEGSVLASVLLSNRFLPKMVDLGLEVLHFKNQMYGQIYGNMLKLYDDGSEIDSVMLCLMSPGLKEIIEGLDIAAPNASSATTYAKEVISFSRRRRVAEAGRLLVASAQGDDAELREQAEGLLSEHLGSGAKRTFSPGDLGTKFLDRLERGKRKSWPLPSQRLTELIGGLRPGEVTLIGGWTSHGKSVYLDNILEHVSGRAKAHLFINEMTADERTDRMVARKTGIPALRVSNKQELTQEEMVKVVDAAASLPFGVTESSGWNAQDLRREIRRRDYDVVGVDILHLIEYREERDLAQISRTLNIAAKESNCHILATVHLKDERLKTSVPPPPTLSDIKGAGALKQDADNVLFVYRECDEIGTPQIESKIWWAKARQGQTGGMSAIFSGSRMEFREQFYG